MILRTIKWGVVGVVAAGVVGGLVFGHDLASYVHSSARSVRTAVKDSVPVEFELERARDLLEDIIPEMQANVRLIAQEEVEVAAIQADIEQQERAVQQTKVAVTKLRGSLDGATATKVSVSGRPYTRQRVKEELARRFDQLKESEILLEGKRRLLATREKSLRAAMDVLDRTRAQKSKLETQIEALEAQHRLVQAASVGSTFNVDHSKLAQTERLIREIKKRLDVAERVLAHEARFVEPIEVDVISEQDLLAQVDEHLSSGDAQGETPLACGELDTMP